MARLPIDFHPEARREADAAFEYYREGRIAARLAVEVSRRCFELGLQARGHEDWGKLTPKAMQ